MLVLHSPEHGWKKYRCRECAGEPTPELPELELRTTDLGTPAPRTRAFVKVGALVPLDYKMAAAGREPGEDG
jgi:hypothetical protein